MTRPPAPPVPRFEPAPVTPGWEADALCPQTDPEVFYPIKGGNPQDAKDICHQCPVRVDCLQAAMAEEGDAGSYRWGVRGGYTADERRRMARNHTRRQQDGAAA